MRICIHTYIHVYLDKNTHIHTYIHTTYRLPPSLSNGTTAQINVFHPPLCTCLPRSPDPEYHISVRRKKIVSSVLQALLQMKWFM